MACVAVFVAGLLSGVALIGIAQGARHRANSAADLAALAAAQVALFDPPAACAEAAQIATANGAGLRGCVLDGEIVTVEVAVEVRLGRFGIGTATARARAGPVSASPPI